MKKLLLIYLVLFLFSACTQDGEKLVEAVPEKVDIVIENSVQGNGTPIIPIKEEPIPLNYQIPSSSCISALAHDHREFPDLADKGIKFARPHPGPFSWEFIEETENEFDFSETDKWVKAAQKENIFLIATIFPYNEWDQISCHGETECLVSSKDHFYSSTFNKGHSIPNHRCKPCSDKKYENFLLKLVERYDGDGIDDMPGLELPILYYEISNEPELDFEELIFFKGSKQEFLDMTKLGYETVKLACENCQVLHGGAAGSEKTLEYWGELFEMGIGDYFDIANIHFIGFGDKPTLNVAEYKKLLDENGIDKPIWVTEAELKKEDNYSKILEDSINTGAEKIFLVFIEILKENEAEVLEDICN